MATSKQIGYAMVLMGKAGYPTQRMAAAHKSLGARMNERQGTVEGWVRSMDTARASQLIDNLIRETGREAK